MSTALILSVLLGLTGCKRKNHWDADISAVSIPPMDIKRYEKILFTINPFNIAAEIAPHADDFDLFLGEAVFTEQGQNQLYEYITDPFIREIWMDTNEQWEDVSVLEQELQQAFRYYKYHFPQMPLPVLYSYISGLDFDYPVKYYENNLIIGLDMFLGADYANYEKVGIPVFKRNRFVPEAAKVEIMRALAEEKIGRYPFVPESLLDYMVFEGKLLYFLDCMFPDVADSLKVSYTNDQISWAERNQGQAWAFYLDNDMLYSTDRQMIQKFIGAAPFTAPFSRGSAPRMAAYNGWQIVREYMRRNQDVSLEQLFSITDSREILNRSRYRP